MNVNEQDQNFHPDGTVIQFASIRHTDQNCVVTSRKKLRDLGSMSVVVESITLECPDADLDAA